MQCNQTAVATQLLRYADLQLYISLLWDKNKRQKRMVQTFGQQRILRTDAFIINTSVLERSCSLDSLQNIPFNSLSSAFSILLLPCSTRLIFYLTAVPLVCVGVDVIEKVSAMKIKRERMMVGQRREKVTGC